VGKADVECASVTATAKPSLPLSRGDDPDYQRIVKIRLEAVIPGRCQRSAQSAARWRRTRNPEQSAVLDSGSTRRRVSRNDG
jgi:hypothetical protein